MSFCDGCFSWVWYAWSLGSVDARSYDGGVVVVIGPGRAWSRVKRRGWRWNLSSS